MPSIHEGTILEVRGDGRPGLCPLVNVKAMEGLFSPSQKREIISAVTDAVVAIGGEELRSVTWVIVEEVQSGDWGIAGKPVTVEGVRALGGGCPRRIQG